MKNLCVMRRNVEMIKGMNRNIMNDDFRSKSFAALERYMGKIVTKLMPKSSHESHSEGKKLFSVPFVDPTLGRTGFGTGEAEMKQQPDLSCTSEVHIHASG